MLQFDLVQLLGGRLSSLNSSALASALNSSLSSAIGGLPSNGTVDAAALLGALGIAVPPGFCVTPLNTSAVSLSALCANNATLVRDLIPGASLNLTNLLGNFNLSLPANSSANLNNISFVDVCSLNVIAANNLTVDVSNLTNIACFGGFNLSSIPVNQLQAFLAAFSLGDINGLLAPQIEALLRPGYNLTVLDTVEAPDGKWPGALGNVIYLDMVGIPKLLSRMLPANTNFLTQLLTIVEQSGGGSVNITGGASLSTLISSVQTLNTVIGALKTLTPENMPHYALLAFAMIKNRYPIYLQDADASQGSFTVITNEISNRLGFNFSVTPTIPVQVALSGIRFIKLFLDQIFGSVMAVLVVLGSMLIYSLLLGNVSDKTYEYGMLRALGFERSSLIGLLFITAMFFTLPGIGLGLLAAWLLWVPVSLILGQLTSAPTDYSLEYSSIILGVVVGFVMPIVANIGPIRRALSRTLRDSLDVYHNVQSETTVRMVKLKGMGLSLTQVVISIIMIVVGFLVYYLIPYAFTYNNFALFLGVLQVILLSMVLGLCLVASTTQPWIERGVLWLIVWGSDAKLLGLMNKNMSAHRPRNQKTALMFTLSLGFMIFAGASFSLQAATVADTISSVFGADINFFAPSWNVPLPEETIRAALQNEMSRNGTLLMGWAFASFALRGSSQRVSETRLSNLAGEPNRAIQVYGLEANHLDVVYQRFYQLVEADSSVKYNASVNGFPDVIKSLVVSAGQQQLPVEAPPFQIPRDIFLLSRNGTDGQLQELSRTNNNSVIYKYYVDVVMSESMRFASTVSTSTPLRLSMVVRDSSNTDRRFFFLAKARGMASKVPGFFLSSYRQTATNSPVFVSMNAFADLTDVVDKTMEATRSVIAPGVEYKNVSRNVPKQNLWMRMDPRATTRETQEMIDRLRAAINDDRMQSVNIRSLVEGTGTASNAMLIFFYVVAIINSVLAFFLLWQSFDANVRFNGWEVGVIRSLGVTTSQVIRIYVYEAIAVVFTAVGLGTIVGILVSVVLTLQFGLFLELPFVLYFPWVLFLIVLILSLALAVIGAYVPAEQYAKRTISTVIRGN